MPLNIFNTFAAHHRIAENAVPLFDADSEGYVKTRTYGKNQRIVLKRSDAMNALIISQVDLMLANVQELDGLIYMMFHKDGDQIKPLYIGKAETVGRINAISVNVADLRGDTGKFARWGDGYQYHIGDLSAAVIPGHNPNRVIDKYRDWGKAIFEEINTTTPRLKQPVYFWCKAWNRKDRGIWGDLAETRLTFLEYLMIGIASDAFPTLLNREGKNRD